MKSPAFVNTPRYSEVSLAGARGFFLSLLERFFHVKSVSPCCDSFIILHYLIVANLTSTSAQRATTSLENPISAPGSNLGFATCREVRSTTAGLLHKILLVAGEDAGDSRPNF